MSTPRYFCHTCKKDIVPIEELTCPTCNGEFVEEVEEDDPPPVAQPQPLPQAQQQNMGTAPELLPFAQLWRQMFPYMQNNNPFAPPVNINNNNTPNNTSNTSNAPGAQSGQQGQQQQQQQQQQRSFTFQSGPFQIHGVPSPFFHMHHTHANNNQQNPQMPQVFQFPMNNFPMNNFFEALSNIPGLNFNQPLAGNPGDYVFGPNFENILNQLFQNANHTGNPPAAKSAIDELNKGEVNETHVENKADCAICKEEFALGSEYIEMPCKHIFDKECILQWLAIHNSCPVCRLELKTDNADYETRRQR